MDATIIYYSSNKEDWLFEKRVIKMLLKNCGDLPIVSVTQKPINFGKNICVGDVGASGFNMFKQVQIACSEAKTKFVISAEADSFYPYDYFQFIPERDDIFYRNSNIYLMGRKRDYFYKKSGGSTFAQIVGREHYLNILDRLFKGAPKWCVEEKNFPKERWKQEDITNNIQLYNSINPCFQIKTGNSMRHYCTTRERTPIYELPYWGSGKMLKEKFEYGKT